MAAKYFSDADIEEFRDCFFYHAKDKIVTDLNLLATIIRSLGFSPTLKENEFYFKTHQKENKIDFAMFLEILHVHMEKEKCQQDILNAFKAYDKEKTGMISYNDMVHFLSNTGEKLSMNDIEKIFKESGIIKGNSIKYIDFMKSMLVPIPDY